MPKQGRNRGQITAEGQTALAASDCVVGAGWGTASVFALAATANDVAGNFSITASTSGVAQSTATLVITFKTPYAATPRAVLTNATNDNSIDTGRFKAVVTTTTLTLTHSLTPVDAKVYLGNYVIVA